MILLIERPLFREEIYRFALDGLLMDFGNSKNFISEALNISEDTINRILKG